jgi:hypothetical protein
MSGSKRVVLIHPGPERACMPELADALRRAGAEVEQYSMTDDLGRMLDALQGDALPVVVKG